MAPEERALEEWRVPEERADTRLDRALSEHLELPRNRVQAWIREGRVAVNGAVFTRPAHTLSGGDLVRVERPPDGRADERIRPEAGALAVLHEDADLVALDKPAGLVVHPGAGQATGTLVHRLLARYPEMAGVGGPGRPGIVHRLDKGTSGVMALARNAEAYQALSRAFAQRAVEKRYLAVVYGVPRLRAGSIEAPIGRHPQRRKEMAVRSGGRPALTLYRRLAARAGVSVLELDLKTGRTHQIRVHLKSLGHPLVGDETYGERRWKGLPPTLRAPLRRFPRPALHAWTLRLAHPRTGEEMRFQAPIPEDLRRLWQELGGGEWPEEAEEEND